MSKLKTKEDFEKEIKSAIDEISDLLAKSYPLAKDDEQEQAPEMAPEMEAPAPEMEQAPEMAPEMEAPAPEMQEGQEGQDEMQDMEADLKSMSDEELDMLLEALQAEKAARQPAPEAPMAPAPEMDKSLQKSVRDMNERLEKALNDSNAQLAKITSELEELKKAKRPVVVSKPISSNKVEALEKSQSFEKQPERLEKSETVKFLETQVRKGNKQINARVMSDLHYCQTPEELVRFQDRLVNEGIVEKFPTK
jgi:hypothetical protein